MCAHITACGHDQQIPVAGILDQPLSHQEVVETGAKARVSFRRLLDGVVQGMEL